MRYPMFLTEGDTPMTILFTQYWDVNPGEYDDYA